MSLNIPSAKLKQLVKLAEHKEALMAKIQEIDRQMLELERQFGHSSADGQKGRFTFSTSSQSKTSARKRRRSRSRKR